MAGDYKQAAVAIDAQDEVGESPTWDASRDRLLWVDHSSGRVHEAKMSESGHWAETKVWELRRYLAAVIPRKSGGFVALGATSIDLVEESGVCQPFARLESEQAGEKLNDAKCDSRGRIWTGSLTVDFLLGAAALYRVDVDGTVVKMLDGLTLANGLAWSPDERTFYLIDSLAQSVDAFDFDIEAGALGRRRPLIRIENGAPNGMTVDADGGLWVAITGAAEVHHYAADGRLLGRVGISTPGATSCEFGGAQRDILFITSRSGRMPDIAKNLGMTAQMMNNDGTDAGALFTASPGAKGLPSRAFTG
jgi:sugar lactone lactonase YvrE